MGLADMISSAQGFLCFLFSLYIAGQQAYHIRLYAIKTYGYVIHEFDPWFNYRATEYLAANGWHAFFHWYDYMSWYPLGRPVGTTIYPGMQIIAVGIWKVLNEYIGYSITLNDVCCLVPAWFGVAATVFCGLLALECSGKYIAGSVAAFVMAIVPAHIMRSVAGGYDNESVAKTAMMLTFYTWVRALRPVPSVLDGRATWGSVIFGALCGLSYVYMVAAWGGYIFVLNMIGAHAAALVVCGRYTSKLHRAYTLFYLIGTWGAIRVPPVGMKPLKDLEQLMPLAVFLGFQVLEYVNIQRRKKGLSRGEVISLLFKMAVPCLGVAVLAVLIILPTGYFGPLSSRIRGLFLKHTRTGNPLVDSVAEHQPGSNQMYFQYLHHTFYLTLPGFFLAAFRWTDSNSFLVLYAFTAYNFANKMARLVILLGPPASALSGVTLAHAADFLLYKPFMILALGYSAQELEGGPDSEPVAKKKEEKEEKEEKVAEAKKEVGKKPKVSSVVKARQKEKASKKGSSDAGELAKIFTELKSSFDAETSKQPVLVGRLMLGMLLIIFGLWRYQEFYSYSHQMAEASSRPQIMFKAQLNNGQSVMVDDYREAYFWLRDKTPEDARVMAWWDYGYQITGIGNRTSLADGNTWNHEHIATLGRILTAPEEDAHSIARHLADYVLVWAGGGGDDLAKSPHLARIGNSVFHGHCGDDPTCSTFGFYGDRRPTPMMAESLLYKLVSFGQRGVEVNQSLFEHKYSTKYGKVRIYKVKRVSLKSKQWVADTANKLCDAPGSWYCTGQYPPALKSFIESRHNFKQLEDFNVKKDAHSKKYHEEYMRRMAGGGARSKAAQEELKDEP